MNWWVLRREIHVSWLVAFAAGATVCGVYAASLIGQSMFGSIAWLLTGTLLILVGCWRQWIAVIPLCVFGGLLVGLWRGSVVQSDLRVYSNLIDTTVELQGTVQQDVAETSGGQVAVRLTNIVYQRHKLPGVLWVTVPSYAAIERSDRIIIRGKLQEGFGNFAGVMYRGQIVSAQRPVPGDRALHIRDWFSEQVRHVIPGEEASLGLGYLLGMRRGLPPSLENDLRIAGLTHIIVASGFHLSVVVRFGRRWLTKVSRFSAFAGSGFLMIFFIMVTGVSPSMARAGLVTSMSLLAWYYGRKIHPLVLIPLAAAATVMITPSYAWGDIGWLLSFLAFFGVMVVAPLLQQYFFGPCAPNAARQILGETVAAQIVTLPILIVTFGYVSNLAIIANILILPFVSLAMMLVLLSGVTAWLLPFIAGVVAAPATWLLDYMIFTVTQIAQVEWATTEVSMPGWAIAVYYMALIAACWYMSRATHYSLYRSNIVE